MVDSITKRWIRNASDELAVRNGCWFDESQGQFVVDWIEQCCILYEGEYAGQSMVLRDWQHEVTMRLFGWMRHSKRWDRKIRRFREASIWVPKKNKKSPTLAAWGLYLTCGDGEQGGKVFFGAKDGSQAREIAGEHAFKMVQQSELLQEVCTMNLTKMRITHRPSNSYIQPMSSSNQRTQKSKEGLNGSILIDETHVVDREFIDRIKRAGISRSEPLRIEVSTAGNDPDSYGKERFDYSQLVESGHVENDHLLVAIYAAPQDLSETDLENDPVKYGKMANPAWGHTIDETEYLADYNSSKHTRRELLNFMMYRLNIWQNTANPWLKIEDWTKGARDFLLEDFRGRTCHSSLDLSSVRDFTSLCLGFDEGGEEIAEFWWYWLPEETAKNIRHLVDIDAWLADDRVNLMLTPGARIDYGYIQSTYRDLAEKFNISTLAYDDWNAEKTTQEISEGVRDNQGHVIVSGTGVERVNFGQGLRVMNEPTKQFEARVIDGKILHNGDPLTAWMVQNATVKSDANGNYKPMKPDKDSVKKIDGVITGVMTAAMIIANPEPTYDFEPGSLAL